MQKDKRFRVVDKWALASDGIQWIVQHRTGKRKWLALSFVRTRKDILARCLAENGCLDQIAEKLLKGLPADFEAWHESFDPPGYYPSGRSGKIVMEALDGPISKAA